MSFTSVADDYVFAANDTVQVQITFGCTPFTYPASNDILAALASDPSMQIGSVSDVSEAASDWFTLQLTSKTYYATLNPAMDGVTAGGIRTAATQAMATLNAGKTVSCNQVLIAGVSKQMSGGLIQGLLGGTGPDVSTNVSLVSMAIIGVVLLVLFTSLKGEFHA